MNTKGYFLTKFVYSLSILLAITLLNGCGASMTKLTKATNSGNMAAIQAAVKGGAKINELDGFGKNSLHLAAAGNQPQVVDYLLKHGANSNMPNKRGAYPVAIAASGHGNIKIIKLLIVAGANVNQDDGLGNMPIHFAVKKKDSNLLKYLLNKKAHVNIANKKGEYPIVMAAKAGNVETIKLLLKAGADVNQAQNDGDRALHEAAREGHVAIVKILVAKGAEIEAYGYKGYPPIAMAAVTGKVEVIKILLAAGANPNKPSTDGNFTIVRAGKQKNLDTVKLLLASGANVNQINADKSRVIYEAARKGNSEMIDFLVSAGAEVDFYAYNGWTPLTAAADNGHSGAVRSLLAAGADPDFTNSDGTSAVYTAAKTKTKTVDVIKYLIAAGANLNKQQGKYNWTAVHVASSKGYMKTMKQFLKAGADPDIKDKDGDTALHLAANEGRYSTVEALLQYGASPNLRNRKGQTASDLGKGYKKTSAALAAYGGRTNKKRSSSFGKIFATVAVAGIAGSANISANNRAKVMSATVNDIWVKDGKGKQLSNMYQKSLQDSSPARSNNPTVREMMNTRSQQQSASAIYNEEMKKYQEIIKQQKLKQRKPSLYQQQLNRIASQTNSKNQKNTSANTVIPVNPTQSRLNSNASSKPRNSNTSVAYNPTNTSQPSGRSQADKCTTFTPPLSTHPLPILTSKGIDHLRSDGAEPTLLRKANEHMTRTCGNKNFSVGRQIRPTWNREIIEKRRFFDKVELTLKDGQTFSCLCTPKKVNRTPGRGVAR